MILLVACSSTPVAIVTGEPSMGDDPVDTAVADTGDSGPPPEPLVTEEGIGDTTVDNDWIFDDRVIHRVDITLDDDAWYNLLTLPYDWAPADFAVDGVPAPDVGVRLRGKIGSYRAITGKPKFKIDFNQYREGRDFFGLEHLSLNNSVVDCSYLKEILGYTVVGMAGLPTLRAAFADVYVNGVDYGLYVMLETPDKRWLERNYADASGNLYDGKYLYDYTTGSYTLLDFVDGVDDYFQLEEGSDVSKADVYAVTAAHVAASGSGQYEALTPTIDWPHLHAHLAVEQWLGHNDGYALNTNNYRFYFDPADRLMDMFIWDLDYAFLEDSWWGMSWGNPRGVIAAGCWADATCRVNQQAAVAAVLAGIDTNTLAAQLDAWDDLTGERAYTDPRRECSVESVASYRQWVHDWIPYRGGYMTSAWGL